MPELTSHPQAMNAVLTLATWLRSLIHTGIVIYGLLFMIYLAARLTVGERSALVALANNLLPWLCWLGMALGALGLLFHDRWLLVALHVPALVAFALAYGGQFRPAAPPPALRGPTLTTVMYNVCG